MAGATEKLDRDQVNNKVLRDLLLSCTQQKNMELKLICFSILLFSATVAFSQITFDDRDWAEIIQEADSSKKLIFVYIYSEWAGPCVWMEENVFNNDEVATLYNERFLNVRVHMESPFGKEMKRVHGIKKIPTYIYLDHTEKEVYSRYGKLKPKEFIELSKGILRTY
ncbi:MAG: thioredoxin family protein [Bacteroidota bacterium]